MEKESQLDVELPTIVRTAKCFDTVGSLVYHDGRPWWVMSLYEGLCTGYTGYAGYYGL